MINCSAFQHCFFIEGRIMNKKEALKIYKDQIKKMQAYYLAMATLGFDRLTIAPKDGSDFRNEMISVLDGEYYQVQTDPKFVEAVLYLAEQELGKVMNRDVYLAKRSLEDVLKFSKEEMMEFSLEQMKGNDLWYEAKMKDDYSIFKDQLIKLIELSKKKLERRNPKKPSYDIFLDDFEEGMDQKKYDHFFSLIRKELLPLIKKINKKKGYIDDSFLYLYYPADKQALFMKDVMEYLGYSSSWGYLGVTEHPFTNGISRNDVRVTTNYDEHNIASAIFSVIHECGHAFYEHQVDPKYDDLIYIRYMSSGMHESQSRFFENYLARRKSFFKLLYPKLQEYFPENLENVSLDDFIRAINASQSSLIRTEADELTYPIHILIRYELEKDIFNGKADLNNLDKLWDNKYEKYLGIKAEKVFDGILQDIHWSDASFGYFPTYALGSAIGAQLIHQMEKDLNVDELLEKGKFNKITAYLKKNVQHYGALYNFEEIMKLATGEGFDPKYYIDYLKDKYTKLYDIK